LGPALSVVAILQLSDGFSKDFSRPTLMPLTAAVAVVVDGILPKKSFIKRPLKELQKLGLPLGWMCSMLCCVPFRSWASLAESFNHFIDSSPKY